MISNLQKNMKVFSVCRDIEFYFIVYSSGSPCTRWGKVWKKVTTNVKHGSIFVWITLYLLRSNNLPFDWNSDLYLFDVMLWSRTDRSLSHAKFNAYKNCLGRKNTLFAEYVRFKRNLIEIRGGENAWKRACMR